MQERKKKKIVIASVLKPVDETRMFDKIGHSLLQGGYQVSIIGFAPAASTTSSLIYLYPLKRFHRISLQRVSAPLRIFFRWIRLRPDVLIVATHELLMLAAITRIFWRIPVIYDVRENYYLNILHTTAFPSFLRWPLAMYVRCLEYLTSPFIQHYLLAERVYVQQLPFTSSRYTVLENKFLPSENLLSNQQSGSHRLLFSGTLAETTGVFVAIEWAKQLHAIDERIQLTLIGFAPQAEVLSRIQKEVKAHSFIRLIGGDRQVEHRQIVREISTADYGFICYPANKSTEGRIPTKYFEYAGQGLRILATPDHSIGSLIQEHGTGLMLSGTVGATEVLHKMADFKPSNTLKTPFLWKTEEEKLFSIIKSI